MNETLLDNPAWAALTSEHQEFAQGTNRVKRYRQGVVPFVACCNAEEGGMEELNPLMSPGESVYIIGDLPVLPAGWVLEHELPCAQMLLPVEKVVPAQGEGPIPLLLLGDADAGDMFDLIHSIQPGYYNPDTRLLGTYYGIRQEGKLVAMAGQRMRLTGFAELSAVCTHLEYTGRGYAQLLLQQLCRLHAAAGILSILHVAQSNQRAIRLYEHMGFIHRRSIYFRRVKVTIRKITAG